MNETEIMFDADSAFVYIEKQLSFGPRVPGSISHDNCTQWIIGKLSEYVDTVSVQNASVTSFDGKSLPLTNIFGQINPQLNERVLLVAHYDSRPWADQETNPEKMYLPIPGANDGASGTAVLLELARVISKLNLQKGIDFLFTDVEDYGVPEYLSESHNEINEMESWCLGTQYWIDRMPYGRFNLPQYAILLDMVGGVNAKFHREYFSQRFASEIMDVIWNKANSLGYGDTFINEIGNPITDDHIYLIKASIPTVDIIENKHPSTGSFNPTWHTLNDDINNIDKSTLKKVGHTVFKVITE